MRFQNKKGVKIRKYRVKIDRVCCGLGFYNCYLYSLTQYVVAYASLASKLQKTVSSVTTGCQKEHLTSLFSCFGKTKFLYPLSVILKFFCLETVPETPLYDSPWAISSFCHFLFKHPQWRHCLTSRSHTTLSNLRFTLHCYSQQL